jgi:uncharacterized protein (TIGR03437 family)
MGAAVLGTGLLLAALCQGQTVNYTYDDAGRLTRVDYGEGGSIEYSYDKAGNLLRRLTSSPSQFASVSSASFDLSGILAAEAIATGFGQNLATGIAVTPSTDLPDELLGTTVDVTDTQGTTRRAGLISVTPTQISYVVPAGTAIGVATVLVSSGTGVQVNGNLRVEQVAPGLYTANQQGFGVAAAFALRVAADLTQTRELTFDPATVAPVPIDLGQEGEQVFLELFGTGMRNLTGQATATVDGVAVGVFGPVAHSVFPGLDQANLGPLPASLAGRGEVDVILTVDGKAANTVTVAIQ